MEESPGTDWVLLTAHQTPQDRKEARLGQQVKPGLYLEWGHHNDKYQRQQQPESKRQTKFKPGLSKH